MIGILLGGILIGFCLGMAIIALLLENGKIKTALTILMVKKRYAEVISEKKTPNK